MKHADELHQTSQQLLDIALKLGANAAHINATSTLSDAIKLEKNDYNLSRSEDSQQLAIKVHKDWKSGSAATNDFSKTGLRDVAERALFMASTAVVDEKIALSRPGNYQLVEQFSTDILDLSPQHFREIAQTIFAPAFADPMISIDGGELGKTYIAQAISNSNGVSLKQEYTSLETSLMCVGVKDGLSTSFDYDGTSFSTLDDFVERAQTIYGQLLSRLKSLFDPHPAESYRGLVVLEPQVVLDMILNAVMVHAGGDALKDHASRWENKLGEQIASPLLTLRDDPYDAQFAGATGFDALGTPVEPRVLIENGVLQFFMETVDSASRRGTLANGYDGGLHVIKLRGERGHAVELAQRAGTPTLCVHRFSGNIDPITGDYSGTAKNSHLIRNGEITPITETMIAGNLFELLNNIVAVGAVENIGNRMEAPPMLIDGVSVSAGPKTG